MAEDLKLRQKATQELFSQSARDLDSISPEDRDLLADIADGFEAELDAQGVPLYAEEVFAVLTFIETLDADSITDLEDLQESIEAMRLAMVQKISSAWEARDKGFFIN